MSTRITISREALWAAVLVGISGQDDVVPTTTQIDRTVDLAERAALREEDRFVRVADVIGCPRCDNTHEVCEHHPDRPWAELSSDPAACACGAGRPCLACAEPGSYGRRQL